MATCRSCGKSSRENPGLIAIRAYSSGVAVMTCACGWAIAGELGDDGYFYGNPATEVRPIPSEEAP